MSSCTCRLQVMQADAAEPAIRPINVKAYLAIPSGRQKAFLASGIASPCMYRRGDLLPFALTFTNKFSTTQIQENPAVGSQLKKAFHEAVEDYIETCKVVGKEPNKTYKGTFNVRIPTDLHKEAAVFAALNNISLNDFVKTAIDYSLTHKNEIGKQLHS